MLFEILGQRNGFSRRTICVCVYVKPWVVSEMCGFVCLSDEMYPFQFDIYRAAPIEEALICEPNMYHRICTVIYLRSTRASYRFVSGQPHNYRKIWVTLTAVSERHVINIHLWNALEPGKTVERHSVVFTLDLCALSCRENKQPHRQCARRVPLYNLSINISHAYGMINGVRLWMRSVGALYPTRNVHAHDRICLDYA